MINCQSILAKKSVFQNFLTNYNPAIVIGCESWLSSDILSSEIFPSHYQVYRKDRPNGYGGVFIACQDFLLSSELSYSTVYPCELVVCRVELPDKPPLIICSIYRPPNCDVIYMTNLCTILQNIIQDNRDSVVWIAGDMNLPNVNWEYSA